MPAIEVKFLFEGVIFSSRVFISRISNSLNRYEFSINFLSNYLISKYSEAYFLVFENNKFKPVYTKNAKEQELIKSIQEAILNIPDYIKESFFYSRHLREIDKAAK
jgi:hypothetical protein